MSDLREQLHDLVEDVPRHVVPDASAAWATGRRRRVRRRAAVTAMVVVVVALAGLGVSRLPHRMAVAPAGPDHEHVTGYPTRIDYPYWTRNLPSRPGPIAGVFEGGYGKSVAWYAVSSTGHLWKIPDVDPDGGGYPSLSADGTELGYVDGAHGYQYVMHDLVTGAERFLPAVTDGAEPEGADGAARYWLQGQAPQYWSPDDRAVVSMGGEVGPDGNLFSTRSARAVLMRADGQVTALRDPGDSALPAGWTDDGHILWLNPYRRQPEALVTDMTGRVVRRIPLQASPQEVAHWDQWVGPVSPDGRYVAATAPADAGPASLSEYPVFDLRTGQEVSATLVPYGLATDVCGPSWRSAPGRAGQDELLLTVAADYPGPGQGSDILVGPFDGRAVGGSGTIGTSPPVVVADPRDQILCSMWASDALSGHAHRGVGGLLFGMGGSWLSWHWREAAGGVVLLVALALALRGVRRRFRSGRWRWPLATR